MKQLCILTALLVMLRVSGLAPDLPWAWAFFPLYLPVIVILIGIVLVLVGGAAAHFKEGKR